MKKDDKNLLIFGGGAAVIASLCCIGPVIIVLLGLGSVSTALSFGTYSWLFTSIAFVLFGVAILLYLNKKDCCNPQGVKQHWRLLVLAFVVMVALLILLKYVIAPVIARYAYG